MDLISDRAVTLFGIYPKASTFYYRDNFSSVFITVLFIKARNSSVDK